MGVYIRDIEMPANCYHCWLGHNCPKYESLLWYEINKERKADCPLVPVPPHGRLIDADAIPYNKIMLDGDDFYYGVTMPYIDRMPTIIPAEPSVAQREYEAAVEQAQYCERYEPTYDPDTGAL